MEPLARDRETVTDDEKEALEKIKDAAAANKVCFAADDLTEQLDEEIQDIYGAIRVAQTGKPPKRAIWVANGQTLGAVLGSPPTLQDYRALSEAGQALGIPLDSHEYWEVAALRLRLHRRLQ